MGRLARRLTGAAPLSPLPLLLLLLQPAYAPLRLNELTALKLFYNTTSGADWTTNTNWDMEATSQCGFVDQSIGKDWPYVAPELPRPDGPECIRSEPCAWNTKWHGVGCVDPCYAPTDGDNCAFGRVTLLNLQRNSLTGTIPESFFDDLINISMIDVSFNYLSGTIPTEVGKVRNLRSWNMADNAFSGSIPTQIAYLGNALGYGYDNGGLQGLTSIDLSHNNLTGIIPSQIAYLENLESLDLSNNPSLGAPAGGNLALNPGIPTQLGLLGRLVNLNINHCGFSGTIPTQIGDLSRLSMLYMHGTNAGLQGVSMRLSGTLPTQIGKLGNVYTWRAGHNLLSGTIPPEIGRMHVLNHIDLQENSLSGTMPDVFAGLSRIEHWDTYGNHLTGDLPPSIQNCSILKYLYVQNEQTDVIRTYACRERIPGLGNPSHSPVIPSKQAGMKTNWYVQAAEYYRYKYASACVDMFDADTAFNALSGDV